MVTNSQNTLNHLHQKKKEELFKEEKCHLKEPKMYILFEMRGR